MDGKHHHAEAILTVDGEFRLYLGGPGADALLSGTAPSGGLLNPEASTQVFGHLAPDGVQRIGDGLVVGQICPASFPTRFCGERAVAEVSVHASDDWLNGEVRITADGGEEIWALDMPRWSIYYGLCPDCAALGRPGGLFKEELAPFAHEADVIISGGDSLFFQDPASGCTGNASLTPHGDYYVFDVSLMIANCNADYAYLNSDEYVGLAAETQGGYWDYDAWLLIIAAAPDGSSSHAAVTMLATALDGAGDDCDACGFWDY